ncbi:hypothetical protein CDAR_204061 [Caerostris darwini]|uniref:Uncharacterized protein n=1 Tax=Caerostris darwini TaxID=1538125 RepID=A0AAV4RLU0_9ARAC|nr:hypothetical protein CDAR_204061 [Caerostris darwini]
MSLRLMRGLRMMDEWSPKSGAPRNEIAPLEKQRQLVKGLSLFALNCAVLLPTAEIVFFIQVNWPADAEVPSLEVNEAANRLRYYLFFKHHSQPPFSISHQFKATWLAKAKFSGEGSFVPR